MLDVQTKIEHLHHVLPCCSEMLHLIRFNGPGDAFIDLKLISVINSLRHDHPWPLPVVDCIRHGLIKPKLSFSVLVAKHLFLRKVMLIVKMHLVLHRLALLAEVSLIALVSLLLVLMIVLMILILIICVLVLIVLLVVFALVGLSEITTSIVIFVVLILRELSIALTFVLFILNGLVLSEFIALLSVLI